LNRDKRRDPGAEVRIGDTFAARVKKGTTSKLIDTLRRRAGHGEARIKDLGKLVERPVDLTDEGRLLAKLASYGAMLSTLPAHLEDEWRLTKEDDA
jgi:hypothetical protein